MIIPPPLTLLSFFKTSFPNARISDSFSLWQPEALLGEEYSWLLGLDRTDPYMSLFLDEVFLLITLLLLLIGTEFDGKVPVILDEGDLSLFLKYGDKLFWSGDLNIASEYSASMSGDLTIFEVVLPFF